jgi:hypothetical protein
VIGHRACHLAAIGGSRDVAIIAAQISRDQGSCLAVILDDQDVGRR